MNSEIERIRAQLFRCNFDDDLPKLPELDSHEDIVTLQEKVYVPIKDHPEVLINLFIKLKIFKVQFCRSYSWPSWDDSKTT